MSQFPTKTYSKKTLEVSHCPSVTRLNNSSIIKRFLWILLWILKKRSTWLHIYACGYKWHIIYNIVTDCMRKIVKCHSIQLRSLNLLEKECAPFPMVCFVHSLAKYLDNFAFNQLKMQRSVMVFKMLNILKSRRSIRMQFLLYIYMIMQQSFLF